jgi:ABC-type Fe3+-siderophore transport system permease subunit
LHARKRLSFLTLVIPWLTVPFIRKNTFIRFLPTATFIGFIFALFSEVAKKNKLWRVKNGLFKDFTLDISYLYGLYFITTIWIFKLTYRSFLKYLMTNIVADYFFSFHIVRIFEKVGTFKFKKMRHKHFFFISVLLSVVLYIYQRMIEKVIYQEKFEERDGK